LALDRSPSGAEFPALGGRSPSRRGHHRVSPPTASPWHGRAAIAAVATGATIAAGYSLADLPEPTGYPALADLADSALIQVTPTDLRSRAQSFSAARAQGPRSSGRSGRSGSRRASPATLSSTSGSGALYENTDVADIASLTKAVSVGRSLVDQSRQLSRALAGGAPAASIYRGQEFVLPARGRYTSGFGARWGVTHYGIDLANRIGTPIYALTDGVVISSGPASGFGMWVRVRHAGGWISVYGHINRSFVQVGERVRAGEKIAEIGNRGQSTGPHLHFEVWAPNGRKINPAVFLASRGVGISQGAQRGGFD
jgi:murein DD-endopeptidase MepM/ murein hydrolase activator NlpD